MIKTIKNMIGILAVSFFLPSCSDFLQTSNPSEVTDAFYDTKTGQEKLLVDIYSKYRSVFNTAELQYYGTDLYMAVTESSDEKMFNGYDASFNSTAGVVSNYWTSLYKIVQENNILLNRAKLTTKDMTEADYNLITAQSRFLRVLAYYYLVETFGPVPFYTNEQSTIITEVTRATEEDIYKFMILELTDIEGALPAKSEEAGRVSNAAVLHLLGKLYLTRAYRTYAEPTDFVNAYTALEKVITKSGHALLDNYADVFDENNQNNNEIIWAIQYGADNNFNGSGNPQQSLFGFNIIALEPDMFVKKQKDKWISQVVLDV